MIQPFNAEVRIKREIAIIDLSGEINISAEPALEQAYAEAERLSPAAIALNLQQVNYVNSTGIALILGLLAQARKSRRHLVVYGLSDHYMEIFRITRLSDYIPIYADEASALADFSKEHTI